MKNFPKFSVSLITSVLFTLLVGGLISFATGISAVAINAVLFFGGMLVQLPAGSLAMAITKEIWINDIVENLFKDNAFLARAINDDSFVVQGKIVHIPNAGTPPSTSKNRSSLPATVVKRTDADITYTIDEYTSDPVLIPHADTVELSYDKRASVLGELPRSMSDIIADNMLYDWAPTSSTYILRTTGDSIAAHLTGATGNRKTFKASDLKNAMTKMNDSNVPQNGRVCVMSSQMYDQFIGSLTESTYRDFSKYFDAATGMVGKLYGFDIYVRSNVLVYDNATPAAPKLPDAEAATTDNDAVLCWHEKSVRRAMGETNMFEKLGDPQYYGDVYSFLIRAKGRKARNDQKGVVAIVQAAA